MNERYRLHESIHERELERYMQRVSRELYLGGGEEKEETKKGP
jgi:hypothetical protein